MKMKNILKISISVALLSFGLNLSASEDYSKLDVKKECDVKTNGLDKVIQTAEKYNKIAIEHGVEFMRFGMKNSQYIDASKEAIKSGAKEIELLDEKAKPTGEKVSIEFATWRACSFAISALTQEAQAKKTWKLASPSDWFLVSKLSKITSSKELLGSFKLEDIEFKVYKASGHKCPRCWKYTSTKEEALCSRCEEVVK
jgi:hypothetical protein